MATSGTRGRSTAEERIDTRRYVDALRRSRGLIAGIVLALTAIVVLVSIALPERYQATTLLVFEEATSPFATTDEGSVQRRLATTRSLLATSGVLDKAAGRLPEDARSGLGGAIRSTVDSNANIIR